MGGGPPPLGQCGTLGQQDKENGIRVVVVDAELLRSAEMGDSPECLFDFNGEGFGFRGTWGAEQPEEDEKAAPMPNEWLEGPYFQRMMIGGYEGDDYGNPGGGGCSVM